MNRFLKIQSTLVLFLLVLFATSCGGGGGSDPAMEAIQKNKQVIIGTNAVDMPFSFGQGAGVQGFDIDIGDEIIKDLGFEKRWANMPFDQLFPTLEKREIHLIMSSISITDDRKAKFAFSNAYFKTGLIVATRKELETIKSVSDLSGKKIGVQNQTTGEQYVTSRIPGATKVGFATQDDALMACKNREIDAVIGDQPIISHSIFHSFKDYLHTVGNNLTTEEYGVVVNKEDKALLASVNKTLARLQSSGKYQQIYDKWFGDTERGIAQLKKSEDDYAKLKVTPKTIVFNLAKEASFPMKMSRLDGFTILMKNDETGQVTESNPIETSGNSGRCQMKLIPGNYSLSMKGYPLKGKLEVPVVPALTMNSTITLATPITINPLK